MTIVDNFIMNNEGVGITIEGPQGVFIANWDPATGIIGNRHSGIGIVQAADRRPDDSVVIDSANVFGNGDWGFWFDNRIPAVPINHITITNNCVKGNAKGPMLLSGLGPDVTIQNNLTSGCGPN